MGSEAGRASNGPPPGMGDLVLEDIAVSYGPVQILHGVSLHVSDGEAVAVLGANGAGKTTLLRTISGLQKPHRGTVRFGAANLAGRRPDHVVRLGLAHVPEGRHIFVNQTVLENLLLGRLGNPNRTRDPADDVEELLEVFPLLRPKLRDPAGSLSGGQQQVLAIARGLMARPRMLLLDEPSLGLAPILMDRIADLISRIRTERQLGILLVDQNTWMASHLTQRTYILQRGKIKSEIPSSQVAGSPEILGAYLGAAVE